MKAIISTILLLCFLMTSQAQECLGVAKEFKSGQYNYEIKGTVEILEKEDKKRILNIKDDFFTKGGPDLYFVLLKNNESAKENGNEFYQIKDSLFANDDIKGPFELALPDSVDLSKYNFVAVQCVGFGWIHWGGAPIEECKDTVSVSRKYEKLTNIRIYPVPAESIINLDIKDPNVVSYEVYDLKGTQIFEYKSDVHSFYVTDLQPGLYTIKFNLRNNKFYSQSFTVK